MRYDPKYLLSLVILFFLSGSLHGQSWSGILDSSRATDWSTAGIPGGIPSRTTSCSTISASAYGNGASDATSGIQSALNNCASGNFVSLSAGTFQINGNLNIPSNVTLRGQGANQTIFQARGSGNAVITLGSNSYPNISSSVAISGGAVAGSTSII